MIGEVGDRHVTADEPVAVGQAPDLPARGIGLVVDLADHGVDLPLDSDAYNSVGGFVFGELGRLPRRGDTVNADGFSIRVESVRENRVEAVRIRERRVPAGVESVRENRIEAVRIRETREEPAKEPVTA